MWRKKLICKHTWVSTSHYDWTLSSVKIIVFISPSTLCDVSHANNMLRFVNSDLKSVVLKEVGNILFALFFIHSKETQSPSNPMTEPPAKKNKHLNKLLKVKHLSWYVITRTGVVLCNLHVFCNTINTLQRTQGWGYYFTCFTFTKLLPEKVIKFPDFTAFGVNRRLKKKCLQKQTRQLKRLCTNWCHCEIRNGLHK